MTTLDRTLDEASRDADTAQTQALQVLYRTAAWTLTDPRVGSWPQLADPGAQALVAAAADLLRDDPAARPEQLGWGERPASELDPAGLFAALPPSADEWNADYEALFGLLVSGSCPPYETEYIDSKLSFQRSQALADIAGFYRAFGWMPSPCHPERPDHIAVELEFMATLCGMELGASHDEQVAICHESQAKFLSEHLVWWAPALAKLLVYEDPHGFYGAVGRFLTALLPMHRAILGVPAHSGTVQSNQGQSSQVQPSLIERPDQCDGCLLQPGDLG